MLMPLTASMITTRLMDAINTGVRRLRQWPKCCGNGRNKEGCEDASDRLDLPLSPWACFFFFIFFFCFHRSSS